MHMGKKRGGGGEMEKEYSSHTGLKTNKEKLRKAVKRIVMGKKEIHVQTQTSKFCV